MSPDKVKKELNTLRSMYVVRQAGLIAPDPDGLFDKYQIATKSLDPINLAIFTERIINGKTFYQIGFSLGYSEEGVRKRWRKIIAELAKLLK